MRNEVQMSTLILSAVVILSVLIGTVIDVPAIYFLWAIWVPLLVYIIYMIVLTYNGKL